MFCSKSPNTVLLEEYFSVSCHRGSNLRGMFFKKKKELFLSQVCWNVLCIFSKISNSGLSLFVKSHSFSALRFYSNLGGVYYVPKRFKGVAALCKWQRSTKTMKSEFEMQWYYIRVVKLYWPVVIPWRKEKAAKYLLIYYKVNVAYIYEQLCARL